MLPPKTRVIRDGKEDIVPAEDLVIGDIVKVISGVFFSIQIYDLNSFLIINFWTHIIFIKIFKFCHFSLIFNFLKFFKWLKYQLTFEKLFILQKISNKYIKISGL